jgi:hypothetical protein
MENRFCSMFSLSYWYNLNKEDYIKAKKPAEECNCSMGRVTNTTTG